MGHSEELRVLTTNIEFLNLQINVPSMYTYFPIQEIFDAVDSEGMGDIYQRELIVYLKELHDGKFSNLKVNQTDSMLVSI